MQKRILYVLSVLLFSAQAGAGVFQFGLNNDVVSTALETRQPGYGMGVEWIHSKPQGNLFGVTLKASHQQDFYRISMGGKLVRLSAERASNGEAFAVGGELKLLLMPKLYTNISVYYGPSVLVRDDFDAYRHLDIKLAYEIIPPADLFIAYRNIQFDYINQTSLGFEKGAYFGAEFKF